MWCSLRNTLTHLSQRDPRRWAPLLTVYYLTYRCDFRCPYCSDGDGRPYYQLPAQELAAEQVLELLARVRRRCEHLVLTGGEPLSHPQLDRVLCGLRRLRFAAVVLTTNGHRLEQHLDSVARGVTHLVVSLDTLRPERADATYGVGPGTLGRILDNIERAARARQRLPRARRYKIIISAVAGPDNIDDLHQVADYARQRGFRFACSPQLQGVQAHPALRGHAGYRALFERLIRDRRAGRAIQGSPRYLERMRDLSPFHCRPSTLLALTPGGDVFYPCLERGQLAGNLLATADLDQIRAQGRARFGAEPRCDDNRCHSACALGFGVALSEPLSALEEAWIELRTRLRGPRG